MTTELHLINWRSGNVQAERLGAKILIMEGYESVDPQCPLGGPDGLKDIVCEKNGWKYIAACYFGIDQKEFKDVKEKFVHDLEGVEKNGADGIVFITNQHITPTQRKELESLAENDENTAIIYHKERLVALLNSPLGYGIRLELFGIEMNKEEQTSFFSQQNNYLKNLLDKQSEFLISEISKRIDGIKSPISRIEQVANFNYETTLNIQEFLKKEHEPSDKSKIPFPKGDTTTAELTIGELCSIHKLLLFSESSIKLGQFRNQRVWIGSPMTSGIENATYIPPEPDLVTKMVEKLLSDWKNNYEKNLNSDSQTKINALVDFHFGFLKIHPFLDGNGRVARYILNQQATEFFNVDYKVILKDNDTYFAALNEGHKGNLEPLKRVLTQAIFGKETIE